MAGLNGIDTRPGTYKQIDHGRSPNERSHHQWRPTRFSYCVYIRASADHSPHYGNVSPLDRSVQRGVTWSAKRAIDVDALANEVLHSREIATRRGSAQLGREVLRLIHVVAASRDDNCETTADQ